MMKLVKYFLDENGKEQEAVTDILPDDEAEAKRNRLNEAVLLSGKNLNQMRFGVRPFTTEAHKPVSPPEPEAPQAPLPPAPAPKKHK